MDEQFKLGPLHDLSTVNESGSLKFTCCMLVRVSFICLALGPRYCSLSWISAQNLSTSPNASPVFLDHLPVASRSAIFLRRLDNLHDS